MKGGELHSNYLHDRGDQCEQQQESATTAVPGIKNETPSLSLCSPSSPSTSSGSVFIARSTTTPLSQGKKYIDVQLLTREHLYLAVDVKCKISDVYRYVCAHIGLNCIGLFGLARYVENEYRFCDQDERLSKYAPKNWQKAPGWGTDLVGNPSVILYLRVHTYVDFVRLINCPVSLLHYYLQLRENVRIQWEPSWVPEERCFEAAALALQADYGDYRPDTHTTGYFRPDAYFPIWVVNGRGLDYVLRHMPSMHHDLEGLESYEARVRYCREASRAPCPVNMHLYRLRRNKTDTHDSIYLGITARGLELFEQKPSGDRQHLISFLWSKIGKLAFDRKKFTLASLDGQKMVFYTCSDEKSRYLLNFCRAVHQNIIRLQPSIIEARKREAEERKQFRESYIYSDTADLDWIRKMDEQTSPCGFYEYNLVPVSTTNLSHILTTAMNVGNGGGVCCGGGGQRVSLVSDASSNTTSGIVSDRQHTHDDSENENEGDGDFEITTGCDSSPLVSELSLATSSTSPPLCTNGSQHSQQASPIRESELNRIYMDSLCGSMDSAANGNTNDQECECGMEGDDEEADPGEGSSSVGPCSDRTVTAAADDTQSTETTSTTGKLEDLCTESELSCAPATTAVSPTEERVRLWSAEDPPSKKSSLTMANGGVSIAELRRLTLHDYAERQSFQRRVSPPILPLPAPMPASNFDESTISEAIMKETAPWQDGRVTRSLKMPAQTSNSMVSSMKPVENINGRIDVPSESRESMEISPADNMIGSQPGLSARPRSYRIISSQASSDGVQTAEATLVMEKRSTPSPPRLEYVVEPPPPPPYPYEMDPAMDSNIAQSYSLSNLPSSSTSSLGMIGNNPMNDCLQQPPPPRLQRTSIDGLPNYEQALPNYEQALQYKVEFGRRMANSTTLEQSPPANVPWLHTSAARRWPTVSGIHPAILDQLVTAIGTRRLQQAQSEPGLAGPYYGNSDDYPLSRRCCHEVGRPIGSYAAPYACSPYAADTLFDGGEVGAYRSMSTYQLPSSGAMGRMCACQHPYGLPPPPLHHHQHHQFHHPYGQYGNNQHPAPACTPNGLYVKQPRAQLRSSATTSAGHRMHAADCQQSSSQLLYNGNNPNHVNGSSKAVARVHSMYEAAKADQIRRSLEYDYYRRFEQQVVQNTRRELRKQQMQLERQLAASLNDSNGALTNPPSTSSHSPSTSKIEEPHAHAHPRENGDHHRAPGHYCESCQENHTAGKIDLAQLKDIIRAQNVDLPLMRALCNDHSWTQQQDRPAPETPSTPVNDSAAHPLLRQKKHSPSRTQSIKPPTEVAPFELLPTNNGRPMTWHESFYETQAVGSSSWPPYEFSYDH